MVGFYKTIRSAFFTEDREGNEEGPERTSFLRRGLRSLRGLLWEEVKLHYFTEDREDSEEGPEGRSSIFSTEDREGGEEGLLLVAWVVCRRIIGYGSVFGPAQDQAVNPVG